MESMCHPNRWRWWLILFCVPSLLPESEVSATGFRANWNPVNLANNYNFIATQEHAATSFEQYNFVNEDFKNVSALSGYYDYTSIPEPSGMDYRKS